MLKLKHSEVLWKGYDRGEGQYCFITYDLPRNKHDDRACVCPVGAEKYFKELGLYEGDRTRWKLRSCWYNESTEEDNQDIQIAESVAKIFNGQGNEAFEHLLLSWW